MYLFSDRFIYKLIEPAADYPNGFNISFEDFKRIFFRL